MRGGVATRTAWSRELRDRPAPFFSLSHDKAARSLLRCPHLLSCAPLHPPHGRLHHTMTSSATLRPTRPRRTGDRTARARSLSAIVEADTLQSPTAPSFSKTLTSCVAIDVSLLCLPMPANAPLSLAPSTALPPLWLCTFAFLRHPHHHVLLLQIFPPALPRSPNQPDPPRSLFAACWVFDATSAAQPDLIVTRRRRSEALSQN